MLRGLSVLQLSQLLGDNVLNTKIISVRVVVTGENKVNSVGV